jgi:hypothetical protein
MLPCPMGTYCPRAWAADPPSNYLAAAAGSEDGGLLPPELQPPRTQDQPAADKWCAPYAYKMRPALGCGGADKWTLEPNEPFPRRGDWWSGNVFCPVSATLKLELYAAVALVVLGLQQQPSCEGHAQGLATGVSSTEAGTMLVGSWPATFGSR